MNIKKTAYTALALALALGGFAGAAEADHSWGNYHWAITEKPFTLELGENLSGPWSAHLTTASSDWNASSVLDTVIKSGNTNNTKGRKTPKNCVPTEGRVEVCNESYGNTGWLGVAQIWASGGHIVQGVAKMNDSYFDHAPYNTDAWRNLVMCQEVAHTFGLGHQDEDFDNPNLNTCMDYTSDPSDNQHPNQHDFDMLETIYDHLDGFTTLISSDSGSGDSGSGGNGKGGGKGKPANLDLNNPTEWGNVVKRDAQGKASIYVRHMGDGEIITHVFWADFEDHNHDH